MRGRNLVMLSVAVLLGLIAVYLVNAYFTGIEKRQERIAEQQKLARIVVATKPLEFGTLLTSDNIRLLNWPAASVPDGAFLQLDEAMKGGRVALRPIVVGEPVLASKVSGTDGRAVLSANLPAGMRAVAIPISATSGVAGFVRPGDAVDVLLTRKIPGSSDSSDNMMTDVVLENVAVLAIDQTADESKTEPKVGKTATLQVDLLGAKKLALAERTGALSLALRKIEPATAQDASTLAARDLAARAPITSHGMAARPVIARAYPSQRRASVTYVAAAAPRPPAPGMTVVRGTSATDYEVVRLRGW